MIDIKQIPQVAFINAQIIQRAARTKDFLRCVADVSQIYGIPRFGVINPAYIVSLLYCLIVVPKEIWDIPFNHGIYNEMGGMNVLALFHVSLSDNQFKEHPNHYLIQRLRNAVAHVNYAFDGQMNMEFWDFPFRQTQENFRASITNKNLEVFLSKVGALLANQVAKDK